MDDQNEVAPERSRVREIMTDQAVAAFREVERVELLLDQKKYALQKLLTGQIDMDEYFRQTENIRAQFEARRERSQALGKLPRPVQINPEWRAPRAPVPQPEPEPDLVTDDEIRAAIAAKPWAETMTADDRARIKIGNDGTWEFPGAFGRTLGTWLVGFDKPDGTASIIIEVGRTERYQRNWTRPQPYRCYFYPGLDCPGCEGPCARIGSPVPAGEGFREGPA